MRKCDIGKCKREARWRCRKLWGKANRAKLTFCTCDYHKPDARNRPPSLLHLPFFYEVTPLENAQA